MASRHREPSTEATEANHFLKNRVRLLPGRNKGNQRIEGRDPALRYVNRRRSKSSSSFIALQWEDA